MIRIDLVLNNVCNFRCSYCCAALPEYQSANRISPMNILRLFQYLNVYLIDEKFVEIMLLGGVPFLYPYLEKIYYIFSKSKFHAKLGIDTNGSILINNNILNAIEECNNNPLLDISVNLSYHEEMLNSSKSYKDNYYNNINNLLMRNIKTVIKLLHIKSAYNEINNTMDNFIKIFPNIKFEYRRIFDTHAKPLFIHDYYCIANNFFGIFPNNRLFYNCEYENEMPNRKTYSITKENLNMFMKNINHKRKMSECRSVYGCSSKKYILNLTKYKKLYEL